MDTGGKLLTDGRELNKEPIDSPSFAPLAYKNQPFQLVGWLYLRFVFFVCNFVSFIYS